MVVNFDPTSYTVNENSSGTVTLTLDKDPERSVTIPMVQTLQGGASDGDYSASSASVTFNSGQTSASFTFTAADDEIDDDGERVQFGFGTLPTDVMAGTGSTATVAIADDDDPQITVEFGAATYSVAESDDPSTTSGVENEVDVTVRLSAPPERPITIPLNLTNHGAGSGDYTLGASVSFGATDTVATVTLTATHDDVDDDEESVEIGFGSPLPNRVSIGAQATTEVEIADDDDPQVNVSFAVKAHTVAEGSSVTVSVSLDVDPERSLTIPLAVTYAGGATLADHSTTPVPANLSFNSSTLSHSFTFTAANDTEDDDEDAVTIGFGNLTGLSRVSAGTIEETVISISDDPADVPAVTVSFGLASYSVSEGSRVGVVLELSAPPERTVTIPLERTLNSASDADLSEALPATVTFTATQDSVTFPVGAAADEEDDDGESVTIAIGNLNSLSGVSPGTPSSTTVNINDGNVPAVKVNFAAETYTVDEGGSVTVTVELDVKPERELSDSPGRHDRGRGLGRRLHGRAGQRHLPGHAVDAGRHRRHDPDIHDHRN